MSSTFRRLPGRLSVNSRWPVTNTGAAFATRRVTSKSIIDLTGHRLVRKALMTLRPYVAIVMTSPPRLSDGGDMPALQSISPILAAESLPGPPVASGYRSLTLRIVGVAPLLTHSGTLANPLSPQAKELRRVAKKRAKTDADIEYLARVEWTGGLWLADGVPCIPGEAIEAAFVAGAKKSKRGMLARAGMISPGNWPLIYDGPRDLDALWNDPDFRLTVGVRVGQSRVMRTRPIFRRWAADVRFEYLDDQLDESDIIEIFSVAGRIVGIGDWRPRFGRFEIESLRQRA